ncbi:MAG TPA: hypothetical protein VIC71_14070 [Gammaproteobacteria bacterium]|jgi:hypothetical protein
MTHDPTQKLLIPVRQSEAGGVVVDSNGRNVWQWKDEQLDSTSVVLQRLDNASLELESTRKVPVAKGEKDAKSQKDSKQQDPKRRGTRETLSASFEVDEGGGFDPYNHR